MSEHDDWIESAGAYVLAAMAPEEAADFEHHLGDCPDCRAAVKRLQVAADALAASPVQLDAPPELKGRIMAVVNAEAELLGATSAPNVGERSRRRSRWGLPASWIGRPGLALAATVLVLVLGGIVGIVGSGTLGGGGSRTVVAQRAPAGSQVKLIVRDEGGHSTLTARNLPPAGAGRVYQVWLKRGSHIKPAGALFSVDHDGSASADVAGSLDHVDQVMVTNERDGGSRTPSGPPVITVSPT